MGTTMSNKVELNRPDDGEDIAERTILIAVDFGTTYSGLAWAQTRRPDIQTPIIQWPVRNTEGLEGRTSDKVPTELRYGANGEYEWGFQIAEEGFRHQWFKLELDPSQRGNLSDLARRYPGRNPLPPGHSIKPTKLVEDYLTALRQHVERVLNHRLPKAVLKSTAIEYIITTPAVWSDRAQALTRECAEKAGMGNGKAIQMISEPEAAAIYALDVMDPHIIEVGDTFVICDAGGGTVDLISYTVSSLKPILRVDEAASGTGGLCGSSYLNRIFERYLVERFGHLDDWDDDVLEEAMKRFEELTKRRYTGNREETFSIPVPGLVSNSSRGVNRGKFVLKGEEVERIFELVLQEIIRLVLGQIEKTQRAVKAVLLVGGFGESTYLLQSLRRAVGSGIEVLVPPNSWTAVVRGALMKGLARETPATARVRIDSRLARKHYGLYHSHKYDSEVHGSRADKKFWNAYHGYYDISGMHWMINKGDKVTEEQPNMFTVSKYRLVSEGPLQEHFKDIYVFDDPQDEDAPWFKDNRVRKLAVLKTDFSVIPESSIDKRVGLDGLNYYRYHYEIVMTNYSAHTKYELSFKGVRYSSVTAEHV